MPLTATLTIPTPADLVAVGHRFSRRATSWLQRTLTPPPVVPAVATPPEPVRAWPTVGEVLDAYFAAKRRLEAWSEQTYTDAGRPLREFCNPRETPADKITPDWVRAWLRSMAEPRPTNMEGLALATRRSRYLAVQDFCRWAAKHELMPADPTARLDGEDLPWRTKRGRRIIGRGKPGFSGLDEAQQYLDAAMTWPTLQQQMCAALPLVCGLREGELLHLRVCDLDFKASQVTVATDAVHPDGWMPKSRTSGRTVPLPRFTHEPLRRLCAGRDRDAYVFASTLPGYNGRPWQGDWVWRLVKKTCELAEVPSVCPHGLRGTWAKLLYREGLVDMAGVGDMLGHGDKGVTARRHYVPGLLRDKSLDLQPTPKASDVTSRPVDEVPAEPDDHGSPVVH